MHKSSKTTALVLAAGKGERLGTETPKQLLPLAGRPLILHSLLAFNACPEIDEIVAVGSSAHLDSIDGLVKKYRITKVVKIVAGGEKRQQSSKKGLDAAAEDTEIVLIHDAARPFPTRELVKRLIEAARLYGAVNAVIPSTDTLVEIDEEGFIAKIPSRSRLLGCQTPQAFRYETIKEAHQYAAARGRHDFTDDCGLVLFMGERVYTVAGDPHNIKLTYGIDFKIGEALYEHLKEKE